MLRRTVRPHKLKPTLTTIFEQNNNIYIYYSNSHSNIYIIYIFSGLYLRELKLHRAPLPLHTVTIGFNLYPCASSNDLRASVPYWPCMHRVQTWANGRGVICVCCRKTQKHMPHANLYQASYLFNRNSRRCSQDTLSLCLEISWASEILKRKQHELPQDSPKQ